MCVFQITAYPNQATVQALEGRIFKRIQGHPWTSTLCLFFPALHLLGLQFPRGNCKPERTVQESPHSCYELSMILFIRHMQQTVEAREGTTDPAQGSLGRQSRALAKAPSHGKDFQVTNGIHEGSFCLLPVITE